MDFAVISDHNTIDGARLAQGLLRDRGFACDLFVGEEITNTWGHLNAYPLKEVIPPELTASEMVQAAHRQGAVIQWNHPDWYWTSGEWTWANYGSRPVGTGLDAWEHYSPGYEEWRKAGALPVFTGSTDTHDGTFGYPERTMILAPQLSGDDLAGAIRQGRTVMVTASGPRFFYGSDRMVALAWKALADGRALREATVEHYRAVLKKADVVGLLKRKQGN